MTARIVVADWLWDGAWRADGALYVADGVVRPAGEAEIAGAPAVRIAGSVLPPLTDFHVHLDLVDVVTVEQGNLARMLDLGAHPEHARDRRAGGVGAVEVAIAGPIHTAPGGYPTTRPWAADRMAREIPDAMAGGIAVAEAVELGADVIKIALNSAIGPVWDDELLADVVRSAHDEDRRVVAHVEGEGQALRAVDAGVDALAHAPFSEALDDELLTRMVPVISWISTLRIHTGRDRERAAGNLARFAELGGRILYGSDMGNGPTSGGVEHDELEALAAAGLSGDAILGALTSDALLPRWGSTVSRAGDPWNGHGLAAWLDTVTPARGEDL
ncbi:MAG: hypothetical protein ABIQ01_07725 [Pseudolysinimonas sp.]